MGHFGLDISMEEGVVNLNASKRSIINTVVHIGLAAA